MVLLLAAHGCECREAREERERNENAKKYGDPNALGTKAYEAKEAAKAREIVACNPAAEKARIAWLDKATTDATGYTTSPSKEGFTIGGACSTTLMARSVACDQGFVRSTDGDSPFVREAVHLGFTRFSCGELKNGDVARWVEFPIEEISRDSVR